MQKKLLQIITFVSVCFVSSLTSSSVLAEGGNPLCCRCNAPCFGCGQRNSIQMWEGETVQDCEGACTNGWCSGTPPQPYPCNGMKSLTPGMC